MLRNLRVRNRHHIFICFTCIIPKTNDNIKLTIQDHFSTCLELHHQLMFVQRKLVLAGHVTQNKKKAEAPIKVIKDFTCCYQSQLFLFPTMKTLYSILFKFFGTFPKHGRVTFLDHKTQDAHAHALYTTMTATSSSAITVQTDTAFWHDFNDGEGHHFNLLSCYASENKINLILGQTNL